MKENINEHDKTKQMMDIIRSGFKSKLITEAEEEINSLTSEPQMTEQPTLEPGDDLPEPELNSEDSEDESDVINLTRGDIDFNHALETLTQQLETSVNITNYKVYIIDRNVIMEGVLLEGETEGSGVTFKMSYKGSSVDISTNGIPNDKRLDDVLTRLDGYYLNWKKEWGDKFLKDSEYQVPNN